jgi:hypothetical protein
LNKGRCSGDCYQCDSVIRRQDKILPANMPPKKTAVIKFISNYLQ